MSSNSRVQIALYLLVLTIFLCLSSIVVQAKYLGGQPPCCKKCGTCSSGGSRPENYVTGGSAISISEGNLTDSYSVTSLNSAFGTTINFSFTYNSYNADGSLGSIDTVMGYGWTHFYNIFLFTQRGQLFRMDGDGRIIKYRRVGVGVFKPTAGYFETLFQNPDGTFTLVQKDQTVFTFASIPNTPFLVGGPVYRLTSITDRNNNLTVLSYTNGNLTSITDTYGRSLLLGYDSLNKLASVTDPLLRTTTLNYDSTGRQLLKITDPENKFIQYDYNFLYQVTGKTDKDGRIFSYLYENRLPVAIVDGAGDFLFRLTNNQDWATDSNALALNQLRVYIPATTVQVDGRGNEWQQTYDGNGYITRIVAPDGATTTYAYDPATLMVSSMSDANNRTTSYQYDSQSNLTRMTNALGQITTYTYEPVFNQMTSMKDPNGRITIYEYDSRGNRVRETDPLGNTREWTYDSHGNVLTEKDKNGNITRHEYDLFGNHTMTTDALSHLTTMTYDIVGNRLSRTDANNHTTTFEYDGLNRLVREIDPLDKVTRTVYDGMSNRVQVVDRNGNSTSYEYDLRQRLVKTTDALAQTITENYDLNNNRVLMTDKNEHTTIFEYDMQNRPTRITDALADSATRTYDPVGNVLAETDANHHTTTYKYDALNRRTTMTDAVGAITRYEYDTVGLIGCTDCIGPTLGSSLITKQIDGNGKVSYIKYDGLDRMTLMIRKEDDTADIIDSSDAVTRYTYDANSNRLTLTEPNLNVSTYVYDALNRLARQTNAAGDITTYTYDGVGNLITRTHPNGNVTTNIYDALDRLKQVDDRVGRVVSYVYDNVGNCLIQTDGNGNNSRYQYDVIYRLMKITDPLGELIQYQYDPVGNVLRVTDRNGNMTTYTYDVINRRTSMTDALVHTTRYEYDSVGNLLKIIDAKPMPGITQYQYDEVNRRIKETYPDSSPNKRTFTYDFVGNIKTRTDQNGQTTIYKYNDLYFLLTRDHPVSPDDNMTYDLSGRLLSAEHAGWMVTFTYDGANRITHTGQNGQTVNYVYDIAGRTRMVTYPGGRSIVEQMDFRNRKTQISNMTSPPIVQYSYDLKNRELSRTYQNGTVANFTYNANDWMPSLEHTIGPSRIVGFGYDYDKEGNKKFEEKRHDTTQSEAYQYDSIYRPIDYRVGQLVGSTIPLPVTQSTYDLDPVGNWNSKTTNTVVETRAHNAVNEITSIDAVTIIHDENGNLTDDHLYIYDYDEENRLIRVTRKIDSQVVGQYQYDALGRRVVRVTNSFGVPAETRYFYDAARIIEEQSTTGVTRATYVYGNYIDEVLTMDRQTQTFYYHQNSLNSTYALTNAAGALVESYQYDAYGRATVLAGPGLDGIWFTGDEPLATFSVIGNPHLFTGRQLDEETGLVYARSRMYSPTLGRFISRDSFGYTNGFNFYEAYFVPNDLDPFGTFTLSTDSSPGCVTVGGHWDLGEKSFESRPITLPYGAKFWLSGKASGSFDLSGQRCCCSQGGYSYTGSVGLSSEISISGNVGYTFEWNIGRGTVYGNASVFLTIGVGAKGSGNYTIDCNDRFTANATGTGEIFGEFGIRVEGDLFLRRRLRPWVSDMYRVGGGGSLKLAGEGEYKLACVSGTCTVTTKPTWTATGNLYVHLNDWEWTGSLQFASVEGEEMRLAVFGDSGLKAAAKGP